MADEKPAEAAPKGSKKVLIVVGAAMLIEGLAVVGLVLMLRSGPSQASAEIVGAEEAAEEKLGEIPLISDKFQNMQTGKTWIWECELVLQIREKNREAVTAALEARKAEVAEGVSMIFRKAQHVHLTEPGLETLNRQVSAYVHQIFGEHPDGTPRVERVIIPKCRGFKS